MKNGLSILLVALTINFATAQEIGLKIGDIAPELAYNNPKGNQLKLSSLKGKLVLIEFWASWCGPCREELPAFEKLYQEYQDLGVEILAVNVDSEAEKANVLLDDIEVSFPVLFDTSGEVSQLYDVSAMPTTVLIDRDGNVRLLHPGYRKGDEKKYEKAIKMLMRE